MAKWFLSIAATLTLGGLCSAQTPSQGSYLQNYYARPTQPLSPYLNLLRGGNPGVNYFYGVRPGTQGGMPVGGGFGMGSGFGRPNLLPTTMTPSSTPIPVNPAGVPIPMLAATGHPVSFGPGPGRVPPGTGMNRPGFQRATTPPPANRTPTKR